ncbi:hypothetical protein TDIS_2110 [Thermosulfurimonas dismutans]|uniref:Uncharacterized protein n=2 Tax=Thermosulfurimonas dismutans TaxID=999894 RepID=A0A179D154_9BACT|nr:hypothetical protein TDIS_2110 [Thermosulfurimonas dismutans]
MVRGKFDWDKCGDPEVLLVREMLLSDPREVLRSYPRKRLREIFIRKIHLFRRENRTFWKLILDISDEELVKASTGNPRDSFTLWPY